MDVISPFTTPSPQDWSSRGSQLRPAFTSLKIPGEQGSALYPLNLVRRITPCQTGSPSCSHTISR